MATPKEREERAAALSRAIEGIKKKYGDSRRTEIVEEAEEIDVEDLIVEEDMVVSITHSGYIKRNAISLYRSQRRGGRGNHGNRHTHGLW